MIRHRTGRCTCVRRWLAGGPHPDYTPVVFRATRIRIRLPIGLRSEATVGEESCLFKELLGVVLLTFLLDLAELGKRFVELFLHPGLLAEEQAHPGRFHRIDEEICHCFGWVGFGVVFAVGVDAVAVEGGFHSLEAFESPGCGYDAIG